MKRFQVIILFIFISLILALSFSYWKNQQSINEREKKIVAIKANDALLRAEKKKLIEKLEALKKEKGDELSLNETLSVLPKKAQKYYQRALQGNKGAVYFYGKVVDQFGKPVAGVNVLLDTGGDFLSGGGRLSRITDDNGLFKVEGIVTSFVGLSRMTHPSIEYVPPNGRYSFQTFYGPHKSTSNNRLQWSDHNTENKAYIFKAWRIGKLEHLISGGNHVALEPDGRLYTLDLFDKWGHEALKEGVWEGGQLTIRHYRAPGKDRREKTDWWFEISAVDGGVIWVTESYMNLAPDSGYQSEPIRIEQKVISAEYTEWVSDQRIYYVSNNGKHYGALEFRIFTRGNNEASLRYRHKLNPNGSRNLALRENK